MNHHQANIQPNCPSFLPWCIAFIVLVFNAPVFAAYQPKTENLEPYKIPATETQAYFEKLEQSHRFEATDYKLLPRPCSGDLIDPNLPWLDRTHLRLSQRVCNAARGFDQFFGDVRFDDDFARSFFRIRNNIVYEQGKETDIAFRPRVRARFHLPNAEERFNLIISDDSDNENTLSTATENLASDTNATNRYSTTLRWIAEKQDDFEIDFDIGARFDQGVEFFLRSRYRKFIPLNEVQALRFSASIFWRDTEGFGERTQLDYEHELRKTLFFRLENIAEFSEISDGIDWIQRTTLWQQLNHRSAISYGFAMTGHTRPEFVTEEYGFSVRFRNQFYSHWLFLEAEPQVIWRKDELGISDSRETVTRLIIRFEIQLGYN